MPCDRHCSCFDCPELKEFRDQRGLVETDVYFCPIAMQGNPTDAPKGR